MTYTKNYYDVLAIESSLRSSSKHTGLEEIRKAYRNALLSAHPDKATAQKGTGRPNRTMKTHVYTVDDVKEAFDVLGDTGKKAEYDRWLSTQPAHSSLKPSSNAPSPDFILGLEVLDLSDFETTINSRPSPSSSTLTSTSSDTEEGERDGDGAEEEEERIEWTRGCRCGAEKGFRITEEELEGALERGEKEVLVGCGGCSLWVRVGFDVDEG